MAALLWLVLAPGSAAASGLLAASIAPDHGVALGSEQRAAAEALATAVTSLEAGDLDRAGSGLERARAAGILPEYVALYAARLAHARGRHAAAAAAAARLAREHASTPLAAPLHRLEGDALAASGDEAGAQRAWAEALAASAGDLAARRELQLAIVRSRQRSGELPAESEAEQLIARVFASTALPSELPPGGRSPAAAFAAGEALVAEGRGAEAVTAYREALDGGLAGAERRRAQHQLGLALFRLRRYDEAVAVFGALLPDPEARHWFARAQARIGNTRRALREFEELVESAPPEIASRSALLAATLYEDRGDHAAALRLYARVAEHPQFPERAAEAVWRIGWSAFRRAEYEEARRRFLQMAEMDLHRRDPILGLRPRYWAARAAARLGRLDESRSELQAIASAYPLTYYGWRAEQQLGGKSRVVADGEPVVPRSSRTTLSAAGLERIALLIEAGLAGPAREELRPLLEAARTLADHIAVGRLLAAAGDYHRAQRLVVDAYALPLSQGLQQGREPLWWLSWPPAYREIVLRSLPPGARIEPALVWAVMREESGFRPEVMSSAGAIGLLQLMPETAERVAREAGQGALEPEALRRPETNIALGSLYLQHLAGRFPDRLSAAIGSYNAGPNAVARWLEGGAGELEDDVWVEDIPYEQTQSYVKRVLRSLRVYRAFY